MLHRLNTLPSDAVYNNFIFHNTLYLGLQPSIAARGCQRLRKWWKTERLRSSAVRNMYNWNNNCAAVPRFWVWRRRGKEGRSRSDNKPAEMMIQPEMEVGQEQYLITVISFVLSTSSVWGLVWTNTCYLNSSDYCKKDLFKQFCKYQRRHCRIDLVD